jgi:tetratricopeptide (TPR) repeat protein
MVSKKPFIFLVTIGFTAYVSGLSACVWAERLWAENMRTESTWVENNLATGLPLHTTDNTLKGKATLNSIVYPLYKPHTTAILKADQLAENYKLDAAQQLYVKTLTQLPNDPGALNGVGKIAYYQTTSSNTYYRNQESSLIDFAMTRFLTALRYQPGYVEARLNLASVYMATHRMSEAWEQIEIASQTAPDTAEVLARQGEWFIKSNQPAEALAVLNPAIVKNAGSVAAHYYRALAWNAMDDRNKALADLNTVLWLAPWHAMAYQLRGNIYRQQGNVAAATESYHQALRYKPELSDVRYKLAEIYENNGTWPEAIHQLKTITINHPNDWLLSHRIGQLLLKNQQPELAIEHYRQWGIQHPADKSRVSPLIAEAQHVLATHYASSISIVDQAKGYQYAEQALQYNPDQLAARLIQASLNQQAGRTLIMSPRHSGQLDEQTRMTANTPALAYERGKALLRRFQFKEATEAFELAKRGTVSQNEQQIMAALVLKEGMPMLAESWYQAMLKRSPEDSAAQMGLARSQQAIRQSMQLTVMASQLEQERKSVKPQATTAILQLQEALGLNIHNAQAHYNLAQRYEKLKQFSQAVDHYYAYTRLAPYDSQTEKAGKKIEKLHKILQAS